MTAPSATYRLQFREGTTFETAARLAPYLARLGISHLYAAPVFRARAGSTHGYDVVDHREIEPAMGGEAGFRKMCAALEENGLGLILDIVPNHMAVSTENPWWDDVLAWGDRSRYARHFDIDWTAPKLLVPVLGEPYGEALSAGKLELRLDAGGRMLRLGYYDKSLPLTPPSWPMVLPETPALAEFLERAVRATPEDGDALLAAFRDALANDEARAAVETAIGAINADTERLHAVHEAQPWRLAHWRLAREALTHRRFFEIADLIGVRVEDDAVFSDMHETVLALARQGTIDGLRIDHIDGLSDPGAYLAKLREASGIPWLLVEKILSGEEELRADWDTDGTTGYEVAGLITALQTDRSGRDALARAWAGFTGGDPDFRRQVLEAKRRILTVNLAGELELLVDLAHRLALSDLATRDHGRDALRRAIVEIAAALPVYRSYRDAAPPTPEDRRLIEDAVAAAKSGREVEDDREPDFIARLLLGDLRQSPETETFTRRFQQTTGALTAKAVEDTVFYRYNPLIALNEVGSEPDRSELGPDAFHHAMGRRARNWPRALSATATHDTKRGEDARARIAVLGELPEDWASAVGRWHETTADLRQALADGPGPDPDAEWLFYQSLLGAWPADFTPGDPDILSDLAGRLDGFMIKALREAKQRTSWTDPNGPLEDAVSRFVRGVLAPDRRGLLEDVNGTFQPIIAAGFVNTLAQLVLKFLCPGVPDIYQGCEFLDLSLVDPDNRRPVDFDRRSQLFDKLPAMAPDEVMADWRSGQPKFWLTARLLDLRRRRADLFLGGSYEAMTPEGPDRRHLVAFARRSGQQAVVAVIPRLVFDRVADNDPPGFTSETAPDASIRLPEAPRPWRRLDGRPAGDGPVTLQAAELFADMPVAVFEAG